MLVVDDALMVNATIQVLRPRRKAAFAQDDIYAAVAAVRKNAMRLFYVPVRQAPVLCARAAGT